jgi:ribonuclease P protein component
VKSKHIISLKKKGDISSLFEKRLNVLRSKIFNINYVKNNLDELRFVIAVSKKKYKSAVTRNKIKRQVRQILQATNIKGIDIAIFANENYFENKFEAIQNDLNSLLSRIK